MAQSIKEVRGGLCGKKVQERRFWRSGGTCYPIVHLQEYGEQLMDDEFTEYSDVI